MKQTIILAITVCLCLPVVASSHDLDNGTGPHIYQTKRIQKAEMACCECYYQRKDGTRRFEGVLEAGFCHSRPGCYCQRFVPCFK